MTEPTLFCEKKSCAPHEEDACALQCPDCAERQALDDAVPASTEWVKPVPDLDFLSLASDPHEALTFHPILPPDAGAIWRSATSKPAAAQAGTVGASFKESNPKDMIGVRKAPLSTVPLGVIVEMGVGMLEGASKYGRHNFRCAGIRESVYFDATMRHLIAYWEGEDVDPDSGLSHLTKAMCSLAVWRDAQMQGMATDDRPPRSAAFYPGMNEKAGEVIDKHSDKSPRHYTIKDSAK